MASPYAFGDSSDESDAEQPASPAPQRVGSFNGLSRAISKRFAPRAPAARTERRDTRSDSDDSEDSRLERRLSYLPPTVRRYVKKKEKKGKGHVVERIILCAVAVILLWTTSLLVAREIVVRVIPRPAVDEVRVKVDRAIELTDILQVGYKACADEKVSICMTAYERDLKTENDRVEAIRTANYVTLSQYGEYRRGCEANYTAAVAKLQELINLNATLNTPLIPQDPDHFFIPEEGTCVNMTALLGGNDAGIVALQTTDDFTADTDEKMLSATEAVADRIAYDAEYIARKTKQSEEKDAENQGNETLIDGYRESIRDSASQAQQCINPAPDLPAGTCDGTAEAVFAQAGADAKAKLEQKEREMEARMESMRNEYNEVKQFYEEYQALKDEILALDLGFALPQVPSGLGSLDGLLNFVDFDFNSLGVQEAIDAQIAAAKLAAQEEAQAQFDKMTDADAAMARLAEQMAKLGPVGDFSDYDPPPADPAATYAAYKQNEAEFLANMDSVLNKAAEPDLGQIDVALGGKNLSDVDFSNQTLASLDVRDWDFFTYPDIFVQDFFDGWDDMINMSLLFDYVYRLFRTVQIIRKYWNLSAVATPPADVRVLAAKKDTTRKVKLNPVQAMGKILTHPGLNLFVFIVFFTLISTTFLSLYVPFLNKYVDACSTGDYRDQYGVDATQDGTFITENAFTVAFQYATGEGDKVINLNLDTIAQRRSATCDERQANFTDPFLFNMFANQNTRHINARFRNDMLVNCTRYDAIDLEFAPVLPTIKSMVEEGSCAQVFEAPKEQNFNCTAITTCREIFQCTPPGEDQMFSAVWTGACYTEWLIHAALLNVVVSVFVFFLANLSRIALLRGIVRVNWRRLTGGRFAYLATCLEDGEPQYPKKVTVDGQSFKRVVSEKLKIVLEKFTRGGYYTIILALMLNVPWIAVLMLLNGRLTFNPTA